MKHLRVLLSLSILTITTPAHAIFGVGDIVYDPTNFIQNITSAVSEVTQELKQVEQYTAQLRELMVAKQQLDDMRQNTQQLTNFNWDDAQGTLAQLLSATNTIDQYKNQLGSFDSFLGKFQAIDYYRNLPCIGTDTCTAADRAKIAESDQFSSESRKKANDALLKGVDLQQQTLQKDTEHLRALQRNAQSSTGRMQVLQAANELASEQTNQLLQIRGLLVAQQNALATQMEVQNDKEARAIALEEKFKSGIYSPAKETGY
ncbi:MAG: P-type conjugative transfer protein TrbJ [Bacteroidia bacterium]|nr:P-type conjugative transfer protein TrbJ [Bacteroidia bacterium]